MFNESERQPHTPPETCRSLCGRHLDRVDIGGGARQLGVSQPAVSQLIKTLEDAIGAPLFVRRNGAIFPTNRAEALREDAVALLAQLDRFQAQFSHQHTGLLSTIRLSVSMSIANALLPELVSNLTTAQPELKFYVSSIPLGSMVTSLVQGHIDFALHSRALNHPGLHNEELISARQVAILPKDHVLAAKEVIALDDLNGCRFISSTKSDPSYHALNALCSRARVSMKTVFQSPFASVAIKMVRPMRAITFSSEVIARLMLSHTPGIVIRDVEEVALKASVFLACADWQVGTETQRLVKAGIARLDDLR